MKKERPMDGMMVLITVCGIIKVQLQKCCLSSCAAAADSVN